MRHWEGMTHCCLIWRPS